MGMFIGSGPLDIARWFGVCDSVQLRVSCRRVTEFTNTAKKQEDSVTLPRGLGLV